MSRKLAALLLSSVLTLVFVGCQKKAEDKPYEMPTVPKGFESQPGFKVELGKPGAQSKADAPAADAPKADAPAADAPAADPPQADAPAGDAGQ